MKKSGKGASNDDGQDWKQNLTPGGTQTEKGDARRRDPDVNKNSQAQKDDVRDGQRDQDQHPKKGGNDKAQDGGDTQGSHSRSRPSQTIGGNQGQSNKR